MGRHTLKFGADLRKYQFNYVQSSFGTGLFLFSGQFSGNAVADALLGDPFVDFLSIRSNQQARRIIKATISAMSGMLTLDLP